MLPLRQLPLAGRTRRGLTIPAVALALVIAMAGLALILDRAWLEAAQLELTTAAETVALSSVRHLASDELLRKDSRPQEQLDAARQAAEDASAANRVAGEVPSFQSHGDDLQFGNYVTVNNQGRQFQSDSEDPHVVRVTLHRTRKRNNPVALFIGELTGVPFGDVIRQADAAVNNQIVGLRPVGNAPIPALPLAIWKVDPSNNRTDTWQNRIEQRKGKDEYGYNEESHRVTREADGIPEIIVKSVAKNGKPELCNLQVLDIGTSFNDEKLCQQFATGISATDLESHGGELTVAGGRTLNSSAELLTGERDALEQLLGEPRICLLFSQCKPGAQSPLTFTTCVELVAVRVMSIKDQSDGSCRLVLQPTVIATRSAVIGSSSSANRYVYNLQLTN